MRWLKWKVPAVVPSAVTNRLAAVASAGRTVAAGLRAGRRPEVWFPLAAVVLTAGGALLLNTRACKTLDEREWRWFAKRHAWQSAFDALSATCGAGLLTFDVNDEYTRAGRWTLTGLGLAGAVLYLSAGLSATRRLCHACGEDVALPPIGLIVALFVGLIVVSVPVVGVLERTAARTTGWAVEDGWGGSAWRAVSAAASLGWLPGDPPRSCRWIYAAAGLAGGLGWAVWLLPVRSWRSRYLRAGRVLGLAGAYLVFVLLITTVVFALEAPRARRVPPPSDTLTGQPAGPRYARSLVQVVCASTAGIPTEELADRNVTDGSKLALAGAVLVGSLGGGVKWTLLLAAVGGLVARAGRPGSGNRSLTVAARSSATKGRRCGAPSRHAADLVAVRCLSACAACAVLMALLALVVALGLLVIETNIASPYQPPPTFASAFLDAASTVAAGNLSGGVFGTVTDRNLSRGIRLGVDSYQYGMAWLMVAMLVGRVLPLVVLGRAAGKNPLPEGRSSENKLASLPRSAPPSA